jgi:uncharacterized protein involved in exopolysaccharide biosynthesis
VEEKDQVKTGDTMDIKTILKAIYQGRKTIYRAMIIAFVLGIFLVLLTPREYDTKVILLAESGSKSGVSGLLGQLGGEMAGMNIGSLLGLNTGGNSSDVLTSDLYPDIVKSTPFLLDVMQVKITDSKNHKILTVESYLRNYTYPSPAGLPGYIFNKIKGNSGHIDTLKRFQKGVIRLSKEQKELLKTLQDMIQVEVQDQGNKLLKKKSKVFSVKVEAQDPLVSALLADSVVSCLKRYVINYNTRKAQKDLKFIKARFLEAQQNFYARQKALADYSDSNSNVILASVRIQQERLQKEYNLAAGVYTSLSQLLEKAKIQVQDHTPVLTVIQPPVVPLKKSAPKSTLIIIEMVLVGAFIGFSIELFKILIHPPGS